MNLILLILNFCYYDEQHSAPLNLVASLDSNATVAPMGEGFLHCPAVDRDGNSTFICLKCYYSPAVTTTLIDENLFYGYSKNAVKQFKGLTIVKHNGPQT